MSTKRKAEDERSEVGGSAAAPFKPNRKVFLEYAPIQRSYEQPYSVQKDTAEGWRYLEANLKVFPSDTAQILEYWVDVSKWSLKQLTVTPSADSGQDFTLAVTAQSMEDENDSIASRSDTIDGAEQCRSPDTHSPM